MFFTKNYVSRHVCIHDEKYSNKLEFIITLFINIRLYPDPKIDGTFYTRYIPFPVKSKIFLHYMNN